MSLPIPLTVRLRTARSDRHVTADVRDLTFRWTDPGGYASCQIALDRPLATQPDEIAAYAALTVYDARSGATVWDGRLEDPGRSAGANGQVWDLVAVGGSAHTLDRTVPLIYVDGEMGAYVRADNATPGGTYSVSADPGGGLTAPQAMVFQFPQGLTLATNARVVARYLRIMVAGQKIARYDWSWDAGRTVVDMFVRASTRVDGTAVGEASRQHVFNTAGGGLSPKVITTDYPAGRNTLDLHIIFTGTPGAVANDTAWGAIQKPVILATRYDRAGNELLTGASYPNNYVLASEVVEDLLGRLLTGYDGAGAVVVTTAYPIDQLAYPDGVTANKVLTDLMALDSGYTWRVWERNTAGKFRFEWSPTPASVRYEADVTDGGYDSQGSAAGLYNQVTVRWRDVDGTTQQTVRTSSVAALTAAGLIRQGQLDLGTEVGSLANAQQSGDDWLADRAAPPNAGRLRITRPIVDLERGQMVQPWEIRPGLIRVRGILPRPDALNATARDGVTIFRIVSCEYRASDASAVLELDSYAPSTARALADLQRATIRR